MLAATLPGGHFFQVKIDGVTGYAQLTAPDGAIADAVEQFQHPDVGESKAANTAALGTKPKAPKVPAPKDTTVTVLNGNGVAAARPRPRATCSASAATSRCCRPGTPAERADAGLLPLADLLRPGAEGRRRRRRLALEKLVEPADVKPLPKDPALRALDPGAMLLFVTGQTFHNRSATAADREAPKQQPPNVRYDASTGPRARRRTYRGKVPFKLDGADGARALVVARPGLRRHADARSTRSTDGPQGDPARLPHRRQRVLGHRGDRLGRRARRSPTAASSTTLKGRDYDLYYSGSHLHMVVLRQAARPTGS